MEINLFPSVKILIKSSNMSDLVYSVLGSDKRFVTGIFKDRFILVINRVHVAINFNVNSGRIFRTTVEVSSIFLNHVLENKVINIIHKLN